MSLPILPLAVWQSGTNENSIPANDNALRLEALFRPCLGVSNNPASPVDGDVYLVGAAPTGNFAAFDENDIAIFREVASSGAWYAWAPVDGLPMIVAGVRKVFAADSGFGAWVDDPSIGGGGGASNRFVNVAMSDMTTDLTTGVAKAVWFAPEAGQLVSVYIGVHDPSSSGIVRVDMNDSGGSVFTTRPAIDATEATSLTGTAAVLDGTVTFSRGDKFTFDIDDAGTDAKGLQVSIEYEAT
jgi:hypothetical protein